MSVSKRKGKTVGSRGVQVSSQSWDDDDDYPFTVVVHIIIMHRGERERRGKRK